MNYLYLKLNGRPRTVHPSMWTIWDHTVHISWIDSMDIFHRWTEVDGRTNTDCPPHGQIRTTDHEYLSQMDEGGRWTKRGRPRHGRSQTMDH